MFDPSFKGYSVIQEYLQSSLCREDIVWKFAARLTKQSSTIAPEDIFNDPDKFKYTSVLEYLEQNQISLGTYMKHLIYLQSTISQNSPIESSTYILNEEEWKNWSTTWILQCIDRAAAESHPESWCAGNGKSLRFWNNDVYDDIFVTNASLCFVSILRVHLPEKVKRIL